MLLYKQNQIQAKIEYINLSRFGNATSCYDDITVKCYSITRLVAELDILSFLIDNCTLLKQFLLLISCKVYDNDKFNICEFYPVYDQNPDTKQSLNNKK